MALKLRIIGRMKRITGSFEGIIGKYLKSRRIE